MGAVCSIEIVIKDYVLWYLKNFRKQHKGILCSPKKRNPVTGYNMDKAEDIILSVISPS